MNSNVATNVVYYTIMTAVSLASVLSASVTFLINDVREGGG